MAVRLGWMISPSRPTNTAATQWSKPSPLSSPSFGHGNTTRHNGTKHVSSRFSRGAPTSAMWTDTAPSPSSPQSAKYMRHSYYNASRPSWIKTPPSLRHKGASDPRLAHKRQCTACWPFYTTGRSRTYHPTSPSSTSKPPSPLPSNPWSGQAYTNWGSATHSGKTHGPCTPTSAARYSIRSSPQMNSSRYPRASVRDQSSPPSCLTWR